MLSGTFFISGDEEVPIEKEEKVEEDAPKQKGGFFSVITNKHFLFLCAIALMTTILMESVNGYAAIHMLNKLNGPDNSPTFFTIATALPETVIVLRVIALPFNNASAAAIAV